MSRRHNKGRSKSRATVRAGSNGPAWLEPLLVGAGLLCLGWVAFTLLPAVFSGTRQLSPVLLRLGPLEIRWYGVLIAFSFLPGFWLAAGEARRKGYDPDRVLDFAVWAALLGLLGAR